MNEEAKAENPPRVFVSYSHDSPEHKKWVSELASKLISQGVDVILDQWDLGLGDDVPKFMEKSVAESDRVLMICTGTYIRKADDGKGGVGYEAMVVTSELIRDLGTAKFIPIVRQQSGESKLPKCVNTRFYVNLSEGQDFDEEFERLLRELHDAPKMKKPAIGPNPFVNEASGNRKSEDTVLAEPSSGAVAASSLSDPANTYAAALELARRNDLVGWRRLVKSVQQPFPGQLLEWRQKHANHYEDLPSMVLGAATVCAPLMCVALAGVESGQTQFANQRAVLDDLLCPKNWVGSGSAVVVDVTDALAFVYQALHGAVSMDIKQLQLALQLARSRVQRINTSKSVVLWQDPHLIGWPESLSGNCGVAWKFLLEIPDKWPWILGIFGKADDYLIALCAYYLALNIHELADLIGGGREEILKREELSLDIPLMYQTLPQDIQKRAYRLLLHSPDDVRDIWRKINVTDEKMESHWPAWTKHCAAWGRGISPFPYRMPIAHKELFVDLHSVT